MDERVIKAGVVGLGVGAVGPLRVMESSSKFQLRAGADNDPEVRATFHKAYPEAKVYENSEQLVADPDVEAVWVQTPNRVHAEQAIAAANAGKHVVVQKPMALDLREAEAMAEAAERNNVHFVAGNSHCYKTPFQMMGQIARGGQTTIAQFFASGGSTINYPQPARFFEFPIVVMPEDYSYIP